MKSQFMYHNVGQGLFHSGQIKKQDGENFNFVYDCGATNQTANDRSPTLDTCIKRLTDFLDGEDIDLLVISHLHEDHINGIPKLLNYHKTNVKNILIPYFTFEERLLLLLDFEKKLSLTEEQTKLILNPYRFFSESNKVNKVFVISHNEEGINDNSTHIEIDNLINLDTFPQDNNSLNNEEQKDIFGAISINDKNLFLLDDWQFAFYADDTCKGTFDFSSVKGQVDSLKDEKDIKKIEKLLKEIKEYYKNSCKRGLNETSLLMAYKKKTALYELVITKKDFSKKLFINEHFASLLTGDFEFNQPSINKVFNHFKSFFKQCEILFLQIPHHGSNNGWNSALTKIANQKFTACIVTYGNNNQYGHPSIKVINEINQESAMYLNSVTEDNYLFLTEY